MIGWWDFSCAFIKKAHLSFLTLTKVLTFPLGSLEDDPFERLVYRLPLALQDFKDNYANLTLARSFR